MRILLLSTLLTLLLGLPNATSQDPDIFIRAGYLYDSQTNVLRPDQAIHIRGNRILAVGDFSIIPSGQPIIDLTDYTVLPGLIDAHTHVFFSQAASDDFAEHSVQTLVMEREALRVLRAAKRAKSYLYEGITTIKELGNSGLYLDLALRDAINEGTVEGPRIFASGPILAAEGGQIYGVPAANQAIIAREYRIVRNVDDARNAVREHMNQGVDLIKICADNIPNNTRLTRAEMTAIVDMAHSYNLTVTAHSITNESAWNAIMAGVDGIEHGFNIADTTLALMAEKDVFLVPTENSKSYMLTYSELAGYAAGETDWIDYYIANMHDRLSRAIAKGVTIVAGSDNYTQMDGISRGQSSKDMLRVYYDAGMAPLDILQSATYLSAQQLKKATEIGSLSPQSYADIIAVRGDITTDFIRTMEDVIFVMKDGQIIVQENK